MQNISPTVWLSCDRTRCSRTRHDKHMNSSENINKYDNIWKTLAHTHIASTIQQPHVLRIGWPGAASNLSCSCLSHSPAPSPFSLVTQLLDPMTPRVLVGNLKTERSEFVSWSATTKMILWHLRYFYVFVLTKYLICVCPGQTSCLLSIRTWRAI